jgi:hypothetical protein
MILRPICLALYLIVGLTFVLPLVLKAVKKSGFLGRSQVEGNRPEK